MATSITKTVWVAKDGEEFETQVGAERYEQVLEVVAVLNQFPDRWDGVNNERIARFLLDNFNITKKES